jgi:hypothetical protein
MILALLWNLILKYQFGKIQQPGSISADNRVVTNEKKSKDEDTPKEDVKPKKVTIEKKLVKWINEKTKPYQEKFGIKIAKNLTSSLRDGTILCALVHSLNPAVAGVLDITELSDDGLKNCKKAVAVAREKCGIQPIMDAIDIYSEPEKNSMMTYIYFFQEYDQQHPLIAQMAPKIEDKTKTLKSSEDEIQPSGDILSTSAQLSDEPGETKKTKTEKCNQVLIFKINLNKI